MRLLSQVYIELKDAAVVCKNGYGPINPYIWTREMTF